jgi:hypothetical protein
MSAEIVSSEASLWLVDGRLLIESSHGLHLCMRFHVTVTNTLEKSTISFDSQFQRL